jgi:hypothetical protein
MPTGLVWGGVLAADECRLFVVGLRVLVGGGSVPMSGTRRPSR